jgi:peptidoglycan/LPS O-acetylase OafA/YrhL
MIKEGTANDSYIAGLDGLRAIAILSVMIHHLRKAWLPGGFVGVDVFFVISGYVISKSLAASGGSNFREYLSGFYRRRLLRIYPALVLCLIVASVFSVLFIPRAWLSDGNNGTSLTAFFGMSNFYLVSISRGYFSQQIPFNPFLHTWSLAVEEQFYLFFPLLFYLWVKAGQKNVRHRRFVSWILPGTAVISTALAAYQTRFALDQAYYLLPGRWWELGAGALLFQGLAQPGLRLKVASVSRGLLVSGAVMLGAAFGYAESAHFPFPWALLPVIGTAFMIAGTAHAADGQRGIQRFLGSPVMTYVGKISYSLYLWHWPVFCLFRWTIGLEAPQTQIWAVLITVGLSITSYHGIENRFRRDVRLKAQPNRKMIAGGVFLIGLSAASVALLFLGAEKFGWSLSVTANRYDWTQPFATGAGPVKLPTHTGTGRRIFVVGDSHALGYTAMVTRAAANLGAEAEIVSEYGCSVMILDAPIEYNPQCRESNQRILNEVKRNAKPGDIVFFAALRVPRLVEQWGGNGNEALPEKMSPETIQMRKRALAEAVGIIEDLKAKSLSILMDAPKPIFRAPPFRCLDWFNRSNPVCAEGFNIDREFLLRHREPVMASLKVLHDEYGVYVWDPFPVLCKDSVCSAFDRGHPVFIDSDHLSLYGNALLVPSFTDQLSEIWEKQRHRVPPGSGSK